MGMLFRTPDTIDILAALNQAFDEDHIAQLAGDATVVQWFGAGGGSKRLWQISSRLGIWPKKTDHGKGRWFKFLKSYLPAAEETAIKAAIAHVLSNSANFYCIRFDAAEDAASSVAISDLAGLSSGKAIRVITLFTAAMAVSDKGDPTED